MIKTPFHKILIANRGEIALRVMRSARALGYRTVAVFSSADQFARHVRQADQAVSIGDALPARSYLDLSAIIAAAKKSGADALHPGYGFLAENAEFARACRDAGLVFIGPSPEAMATMGNKAKAKQLMSQAGAPCIPGYQGDDQSDERLIAEARKIGFPVMIKASAGGGGRGMRLVAAPARFADALNSARSEARSAFGNPAVILERAMVEARHIEIQVFADRQGNAIHLGERDCSVQRRQQKLIEETPSPVVNAELRQRMGATALAALKAIAYEGAGTIEFLLDAAGSFYFMEMNTRLQVEHTVTECMTGLDLVELQLRVASGEPLPITQDEVRFRGHSIEARLCAEDPSQAFMPQSGVMTQWQMPTNIRVEDALEAGAEISPYYDSMIAKLVSHGTSRDEARRKLIAALEDAVALGVKTNQKFLANCLKHPDFVAGAATTAFIGAHREELLKPDGDSDARAHALAAVLLYATASETASGRVSSGIAHRFPIALRFNVDARQCSASLLNLGDRRYSVAIGAHMGSHASESTGASTGASTSERSFDLRVIDLEPNRIRFACDGLVESAAFARDATQLLLQFRGAAYSIEDLSRARPARQGEGDANGKIRASMNGRVVAVHVALGDAVIEGQAVMTLDAMKMEHVHAAPIAGRVIAVNAVVGEQVAIHSVIAEIETTRAIASDCAA